MTQKIEREVEHTLFYDKTIVTLFGDNTDEVVGIIDQLIAINLELIK